MHNFQEDVIEASHDLPVVVDFWAPWCGPCQVLGPILEKLASNAGSSWKLVKVNSDEHQDLARQYGIRGIPAVKMFSKGEVVDEFTGALPEFSIVKWLDNALPNPAKALLQQAEEARENGRSAEAVELYEQVLALEPENEGALIMLSKLIVAHDLERARKMIESVSPSTPAMVELRNAVVQFIHIHETASDPSLLPEGKVRDEYLESLQAVVSGRYDEAVQGFIRVIGVDRYYDDDGARKSCIALFTILGPSHHVTRKHRRLFDMALY